MPRIETYDAGNVQLTPTDKGANAMREAATASRVFGRTVGSAYSAAGRYIGNAVSGLIGVAGEYAQTAQQHQDTLALTDAARKSADFDFAHNQDLDTIMSPKPDPNDPSGQRVIKPDPNDAPGLIGQKLNQWWDDRQALREQITNPAALKKFDQETESSYRAFTTKAYAINGELAYRAAGDNITRTTQSYAGMVFNDPTQLDYALEKVNGTIDDVANTAPGMTANNREAFRSQIKYTASRGIIENAIEGMARTPAGREAAMNLVNSGKYDQYIGSDKEKLLSHIRGQERAYQQDQSAAQKQISEQQKNNALARTDQYIADAASENPKMKLENIWTDPAYANRPDLRRQAIGVVQTMRKFQQNEMNINPVMSNNTSHQLLERMTLEDGDPNKLTDRSSIDQAFIDGKLTRTDYNFLQSQLKRMQEPAEKSFQTNLKSFLNRYGMSIDINRAINGQASALGTQGIYKMQQDVMRQAQVLRAQGQDPNSLLDPSSPNFVGKPQNLAKYQVSLSDATNYNAQLKSELDQAINKYAPGNTELSNPSTAEGGTPLQIAQRYLGMDEHRDRGVLAGFLNKAGGPFLDPSRTAWCARFMNSILTAAGYQGTNSDLARSFLNYGESVDPKQATTGDIIVFGRGAPNSPFGHVGFVKQVNPDGTVDVLGGNQHNSVSIERMPLSAALGVRRITSSQSNVPPPTYGSDYAIAQIPGRVGPSTGQPMPMVSSPEEAMRLPPGTRFLLPDGKRVGMVPYGPQVPVSK